MATPPPPPLTRAPPHPTRPTHPLAPRPASAHFRPHHTQAHADACRLNEELEEAHALHLPARLCGGDTSVPPLASEQQQQQQQASQPRFESWRQKQASQQQAPTQQQQQQAEPSAQQQALPWLRQQASQQQQALPWLQNQAWQQARQQQQAWPLPRKEQVQTTEDRPRRKKKRHGEMVDEQQASQGEHSAVYMCKVLGQCPEGATPTFSHKFPEHTADYMCKKFGKQCDAAGTKQASQQQAQLQAQQQAQQQQAASLLSRLRLLPPEEADHLEEAAHLNLDATMRTRRARTWQDRPPLLPAAEPASSAAALAEWRRNRLQSAAPKGAVATEEAVAPAAELGEHHHGAAFQHVAEKLRAGGGQVG